MATRYLFDVKIAYNPATGQLTPNATFDVYTPADAASGAFASPLTVYDLTGSTITLTSGPQGATVEFGVDDQPEVVIKDRASGWTTTVKSFKGLLAEAQASRAAAELAADSASAAQSSAESAASSAAASAQTAQNIVDTSVKTINGVHPDSAGNINVSGGSAGPIGIGNVNGLQDALDSKVDEGSPVDASRINAGSGRIVPARLGSGTGTSANFLRGDGTWAVPPTGGGGGTGTVVSVNGVTPDVSGNVQLSKTNLNIGNVDNTSDANKPVSTAQAAAIAAKASDTAVVHNSGNETVGGTKTFTSSPVVPDNSFPQSKVTGLAPALAGKVSTSGGVTAIWQGTQAQYDALPTKDATTLYIVTGA